MKIKIKLNYQQIGKWDGHWFVAGDIEEIPPLEIEATVTSKQYEKILEYMDKDLHGNSPRLQPRIEEGQIVFKDMEAL